MERRKLLNLQTKRLHKSPETEICSKLSRILADDGVENRSRPRMQLTKNIRLSTTKHYRQIALALLAGVALLNLPTIVATDSSDDDPMLGSESSPYLTSSSAPFTPRPAPFSPDYRPECDITFPAAAATALPP